MNSQSLCIRRNFYLDYLYQQNTKLQPMVAAISWSHIEIISNKPHNMGSIGDKNNMFTESFLYSLPILIIHKPTFDVVLGCWFDINIAAEVIEGKLRIFTSLIFGIYNYRVPKL